jgi:hypothetical protein
MAADHAESMETCSADPGQSLLDDVAFGRGTPTATGLLNE